MNYSDLLKSLGACNEAVEARKGWTVERAMEAAERGDWILWLAENLELDRRKLTLAKARCAKTVRHLMTDERSRQAIEVAERYGLGEATDEELSAAYAAAYAAAAYAAAYAAAADAAAVAAAYAAAADAAAYAAAYAAAAYAAAYAAAADAAAVAAAYAAAADAAAVAADAAAVAADARKENQRKTAKICVEVLGADIIAEVNERLRDRL